MTLQDCKDLIATECNYIHWKELVQHNEPGTIEFNFWPKVVERYARECVKASLEKAAENAEVITVFGADDKEVVDKSSITSDSNIVLL